MGVVRIIRAGPHAALVEVADAAAAMSLARWARTSAVPAVEIVPAARTVLFDGLQPDHDLSLWLADRARTDELASEGIVLGSVQLPPSGQPVVFLHDHPVTGGYPVIGIVDPADLATCAQLRPGAEVELRVQSSTGRSAGASAGSSTE